MSKPFHVYLDLDVLNNDTNPNSKAPQLSFQETRTQPFLDGTAEDYFVAIARFSIQTGGTLPVFIPAIQTGQSDPNLTVYAITLNYNGADGTAYIRHVPQPNATLAAPPTTVQDLTGDYYYVYNYQDWISMVNTAFVAAQQQLVASLAAANSSVITQSFTLSSTGPITITTSTAPLNALTDTKVALDNNLTLFITNTSSGVSSYTFTVAIRDLAGNNRSSGTRTTNITPPIITSVLGTSTLTGSGGSSITINNTSILGAAVAAAAPPFIQFDAQTKVCTLNTDITWYNSSSTGSAAIYFNSRLYQLFVGFPFQFQGYGQDPKSYLLPTPNVSAANTLTTTPNVGTKQQYLQAYQEMSTVGLWNPISSIVFTSTTLPIHATLTSPPKVYSSSSNGMAGSGGSSLSNTLTDFEIAIDAQNSYRPEISYAPPGEYRLIDMYSNSNLYKIDLNVYWKDKYGNLKPLRLQPGCSASVKLLFRNKGFYLGADYFFLSSYDIYTYTWLTHSRRFW